MVLNLLADFSLGTIADIAIGVLAIVIIIVNISKGFIKQIIGLVATAISFFVAYSFCKQLAEFINTQFGWQDKLANGILEALSKKDLFNVAAAEDTIKAGIASMGLPDFAGDLVVKLIGNINIGELNVGQFLSTTFAKYIMLIGSCIVLFVVTRLILALINRVILRIVDGTALKGIDKLLAALLGIIKIILIVYVVVYIIQLMPGGGFIESLKTAVNDSYIVNLLNGSGVVEACLSKILEIIKTMLPQF